MKVEVPKHEKEFNGLYRNSEECHEVWMQWWVTAHRNVWCLKLLFEKQTVWCTNLAHERATRVTQTCITTTAIKPCTEHVVSDPVQWQEEGPFAALSCWDDWQLHFLQSVRWNVMVNTWESIEYIGYSRYGIPPADDLCGCQTVSHPKGRTEIEGVWEQSVEENICI